MEKNILKIKSCVLVNSVLAGFFIINENEHIFYEKVDLIKYVEKNDIQLETVNGTKIHIVNGEFIRTNPDQSTSNDLNDLPHSHS